jgi:hypothetical protein
MGIDKINKTYKELFFEGNFIVKITQGSLIIFSETLTFIAIYLSFIKYIPMYVQIDFFVEIIIIITCCIIVHYFIGYILLISSNLHVFLKKGVEKSIKADFLLSYFITSVYIVFILLFKDKISKYAISGIIGICICYVLNLKILFTIMRNPKSIKICEEDRGSFGRLLTAVILILIMIVSNLYLGVILTDSLETNAFSNNPSSFDLFYYTIVTFTTIGFGDIIPLTTLAKFMVIIISITSVICLTVFLSSIFSYRSR